MKKYSIRFNKSRGEPGRGSKDHIWRVFEDDAKEYICKHLRINTPITDEKDHNGTDYNIVCYGIMSLDKQTSTVIINAETAQTQRMELESAQ